MDKNKKNGGRGRLKVSTIRPRKAREKTVDGDDGEWDARRA